MFRKKKLRKQYDRRLLELIEHTRDEWKDQQQLVEMSYTDNHDLYYEAKLSKAKYYYLFHEAKIRDVRKK